MKWAPDMVAEVVARIEAMFECRDGSPGSYVLHEGQELPYVTLAFNGKGKDPDEMRALLCRSLWGQFVAVHRQFSIERPILYWRYQAGERIDEVLNKFTAQRLIYTRVAVPGCDWSRITHHKEGDQFYPSIAA